MEKVKAVDLCQGCQWAKGLAEGKECHPPTDGSCPANQKFPCPKCGKELELVEVVSMGPGYSEWEDLTPHVDCKHCGYKGAIDRNCGCGEQGTHLHNNQWCCGGMMCCSTANI